MMRKSKYINKGSGQSMVEYLMLLSIFLAAALSTNFIGRIQKAFGGYFSTCTKPIVNSTYLNSHSANQIVDKETVDKLNSDETHPHTNNLR